MSSKQKNTQNDIQNNIKTIKNWLFNSTVQMTEDEKKQNCFLYLKGYNDNIKLLKHWRELSIFFCDFFCNRYNGKEIVVSNRHEKVNYIESGHKQTAIKNLREIFPKNKKKFKQFNAGLDFLEKLSVKDFDLISSYVKEKINNKYFQEPFKYDYNSWGKFLILRKYIPETVKKQNGLLTITETFEFNKEIKGKIKTEVDQQYITFFLEPTFHKYQNVKLNHLIGTYKRKDICNLIKLFSASDKQEQDKKLETIDSIISKFYEEYTIFSDHLQTTIYEWCFVFTEHDKNACNKYLHNLCMHKILTTRKTKLEGNQVKSVHADDYQMDKIKIVLYNFTKNLEINFNIKLIPFAWKVYDRIVQYNNLYYQNKKDYRVLKFTFLKIKKSLDDAERNKILDNIYSINDTNSTSNQDKYIKTLVNEKKVKEETKTTKYEHSFNNILYYYNLFTYMDYPQKLKLIEDIRNIRELIKGQPIELKYDLFRSNTVKTQGKVDIENVESGDKTESDESANSKTFIQPEITSEV